MDLSIIFESSYLTLALLASLLAGMFGCFIFLAVRGAKAISQMHVNDPPKRSNR